MRIERRVSVQTLQHTFMSDPVPRPVETKPYTHQFFFVLLEGFSFTALTNALETLAIANDVLGYKCFDCRICSEGGADMVSWTQATMSKNHPLPTVRSADTVILCGGRNIQAATTPGIIRWVRQQALNTPRIIGLYSAAYCLAACGLLHNRRATMHWDIRDSVREEFSSIILEDWMYVTDGKLCTTADSLNSIDLMLDIVRMTMGPEISIQIARKANYSSIHCNNRVARISVSDVDWINHPKIKKAVSLMGLNLEEPLGLNQIASKIGLSGRQLERLFKRYVGESPKKYYVNLRLQRAHNLLSQTTLSVTEIGIACGFGSSASFSKLYRIAYGISPHQHRGKMYATESQL